MKIVLWDTRHGGAFKDFAGGFGVGQFRGAGLRGKIIEQFYRRDFRAPPLAYGYLAAGLKQLGHAVTYSLEQTPPADLYIFNPALMTLPYELSIMRRLNETQPETRIIVCGQVASTLPESFAEVSCRVVNGEPEQLLLTLDAVLESKEQRHDIGTVANLDALPFPDWSIFPHRKFQVRYDFWKFPTAYVQSSRGCTLSCSYCPYIILENKVRARAPERVAEEIHRDMVEYGFRSFKFRDPLFGAKRKHAEQVADEIGKLPKRIQFSVESRIELLTRDVLTMLRDVGLTSVTVGIETPSRDTLVKYKRAPIKDDKQSQFVDMCRALGIRVISGFMIGFPEDTRKTVRAVLRYAKEVNPYVANFNVCTPYPGTDWLTEIDHLIANRDWSRYDVYTPNLKYEHLTADEVRDLHQDCFRQYYFRWEYLKQNGRFLFPRLNAAFEQIRSQTLQRQSATASTIAPESAAPPTHPTAGLPILSLNVAPQPPASCQSAPARKSA